MMTNRTRRGALAAAGLIGLAALAAGQSRQDVALAAHDGNNFRVTILVSNEQDETPVTDPLLVNAWGIAASDTGPWWVADNGSGYSTVYTGDGAKIPLEVKVPGAPTGTVHNGSTQFQMAAGTPATFLFASEDGTFSAWNSTVKWRSPVSRASKSDCLRCRVCQAPARTHLSLAANWCVGAGA